MNELLLVHCRQLGSDLRGNFQRQLCLEPAGSLDELLECFPFYELHRIKVVLTGSAQVRRSSCATMCRPTKFRGNS